MKRTGPSILRELFPDDAPPLWGVVLGSGFDSWTGKLACERSLSFTDVDGLFRSTVPGHRGALAAGTVGSTPVLVCAGRLHLYEGYSPAQVVSPIRLMAGLGVRNLLLTTAVGSVAARFGRGEMVAVRDQINLTGADPNTGSGAFLDASALYDTAFLVRLRALGFQAGVLAGVRGPSFETPAEVAALDSIGADLVCMSTVLEVLAAAALDMRVACLAVVANAAGSHGTDHDDVVASVARAADGHWPRVAAFIETAEEPASEG